MSWKLGSRISTVFIICIYDINFVILMLMINVK